VKRLHLKQIRRGKDEQDAEVMAARKLACIVWKILTSRQRYVEEDEYLTARKMKRATHLTKRSLRHVSKPEDIATLAKSLASKTELLEGRDGEQRKRMSRHGRKTSSPRYCMKEEGVDKN